MKIWHQSFTDLSVFPKYQLTLEQHAQAVMPQGIDVQVHGLPPGTYPVDVPPMSFNTRGGLRLLNSKLVCEAAIAAEQAGYDAFALGCFFDPGLTEARSLVDIPIVSLSETCMLTACSLGRKFAVIALTEFQKMLSADLARAYGLTDRLAGVVALTPAVNLFDLEAGGEIAEGIKTRFLLACQQALDLGAEVIIPGDGVLNAFLVRHQMLTVKDATIMDPLGVLFHHAAFFVNARQANCLAISRRLLYSKPTQAMMRHAQNERGAFALSESDFSGSKYVKR